MIFLILITLASFAYFGRNILILMGWLKGPLLRKFERYGVVDDSYTVMPELLMSFVLLLFGVTSLIIERFFQSALPVAMVAVIYISGVGDAPLGNARAAVPISVHGAAAVVRQFAGTDNARGTPPDRVALAVFARAHPPGLQRQ
ncbi:MAG: hypothetical protein IPO91_23065 [Chloroflexi bacterium]|nr:hypothetical protein [Chloroflexota bacterium]